MNTEIGDLWEKYVEGYRVVITTNGTIKKNGECVMGRGCALEAKNKFPNLALKLGERVALYGNTVHYFPEQKLFSFPVKHHWYEIADVDLIVKSARELTSYVDLYGFSKVFMPRPGCGNGNLDWKDVKPILEPILDDRFTCMTYD